MNQKNLDYQTLISYAAGELTAAQAAEVEQILAENPAAATLVDRFRRISRAAQEDNSVTIPPSLVADLKAVFDPEQIRTSSRPRFAEFLASLQRTVADLIYDSSGNLALAGTRGPGMARQLAFASDGLEVDIQLAPDGEGDDQHWHLLGQVSPPAEDQPALVMLVPQGQDNPAGEAQPDEHGLFSFTAEPGEYEIHLIYGKRLIVMPGVKIP
ncbi:MAG TPA: hypothetical protein ENJ06_01770 [Phycisphaeraceae bacterium]|nr:hypothetical protein [Phycisphaeraceae bacterium]